MLYSYVHCWETPEAIARSFPTLTLEQVYASILQYLRDRLLMDAYLSEWLDWSHRARAEQQRNPPPFAARLQAARKQRAPYTVDGS